MLLFIYTCYFCLFLYLLLFIFHFYHSRYFIKSIVVVSSSIFIIYYLVSSRNVQTEKKHINENQKTKTEIKRAVCMVYIATIKQTRLRSMLRYTVFDSYFFFIFFFFIEKLCEMDLFFEESKQPFSFQTTICYSSLVVNASRVNVCLCSPFSLNIFLNFASCVCIDTFFFQFFLHFFFFFSFLFEFGKLWRKIQFFFNRKKAYKKSLWF